ncbi:SDR family oxidoreductase [Streptomyces griseochromogenes]|uniref:SDR family oxidoreductase n=1 Tax=Streptomyces griseochromogenes TaxID=68214 RepID=UPI0037ABD19A
MGAGCLLAPGDLGEAGGVDTVLLAADSPLRPGDLGAGHRVLVEVTSREEAIAAARAGAHGLVARGQESGGRVGELSTFVLLQQLLADGELDLPIWACGGIGPHTAAAAVVGGAAGVVLDTQLALLEESGLAEEVAAAVRTMDGSETVVVGGHRVLRRRGPRVPPMPEDPAEVAGLLGSRDLRTQLLPVGQDGFLAARFAEQWGDVGGAVRAVGAAVVDAVRDDAASNALRGDSPLSRSLGTRLPIAQGPMTRVSDQARFASAVAEHGALPFLALGLAGPEQTRTLLDQTRAALEGRPWGVGVLGFAPEQIKAAQLELIREFRPRCAIIAGGRPAQASALEEAGVATFLHVPSPGLLRQFLAAGARKFVFEGSECGGHVGPRSSFVLWEAQIAVLSEFLDGAEGAGGIDPGELRVLFAGGIHDERSSAMVAALAAPLSARGVAVGVLMGTAYLFTEEAVDRTAVRPLFQRQVLAARRTELLETAPGHATRCVHSPFTAGFAGVKDELRSQGVPDRQVWEQLERLNVGRLRVASKGVERVGGDLVEVDEERQLAEGMFMAGQVAVLRSEVTTVPALHESVSTAAAEFFAERAAQLRDRFGVAPPCDEAAAADPATGPATAPEPLDIAVVGMSCMFPGAADLADYWANVVAGVDAVTEVPAERWDPAVYYAPEADSAHTESKWGGFLPDIPFDPLRYGIPPSSLGSIEPVQLLALEAARRALRDAGYEGRDFDRSRASVVFGAEAGSDLSGATTLRNLLPAYLGELPAGLDAQLPRLTGDSFPGMLANVISGRIANRLDLGGANYTVDAACASSLAAVDVACKELSGGTSDLVLCGGADLHNGINDYLLFSSVHALSPTGRSRTFDDAADGIALGEGVACLVLKRLADAERDGDRVYAVIKGVGSASDGKSLGLTAPRPEGQRSALERAYRNAGISPAQVGLIEAHGTGTVVGDRAELSTLTEVFTEAGAAPGSCALGSVKSQIGHTKCAAGLAGLIKTAMALHTGVKPPTVNLRQPNPAWQEGTSPFAFHTAARPWAAPAAERVAGVSAFGFGGTNFHVVLGAYDGTPPPVHALEAWPAELFVFRGADRADANRAIEQLLKLVEANDLGGGPWRLRDFAVTASRRCDTSEQPVQSAVVAGDLAELAGLLRRALAGEHDPSAGVFAAGPADRGDGGDRAGVTGADDPEDHGNEPRTAGTDGPQDRGDRAKATGANSSGEGPGDGPGVAFLFPGQGSQRPGMLAELFVAFPEVQRYLQLGREWAGRLHPPAAFSPTVAAEQRTRITDTRVAQPVLGIAGLAVHELFGRAGVRPDMVAGHSYGELVALCAAGAFAPATLLELSAERAEAILSATGTDPGTMAAVAAGAAEVYGQLTADGLADRIVVANHNAPDQTVISGPVEAVDAAVRRLRANGYGAKRIPVACAFHSPLVAGAGERFAQALLDRPVREPEVPVWSNRTAAVYPGRPEDIRAELAAQISAPVRFVEQIERMYAAGARVFVEAGPGSVLTGLVSAILRDRPHTTVACDTPGRRGLHGFLSSLAQAAVAGVRVRTGWMFHGRDATELSRAAALELPGWTVNGQLVRTRDGSPLPGSLMPARRIQEMTVTKAEGGGAVADRDQMIHDFLRASREIVAAQRDVLLTYFGGGAPGGPVAAPVAAPLLPAAPAVAVTSTTPVPEAAAPSAAPPPQEPSSAATSGPRGLPTEADLLRTVLDIISERTGYPVDMIEPQLDLEAELSIDSIKRIEIAGELAARLFAGAQGGPGTSQLDDTELEVLSKARTVARMAELLSERLNGAEQQGRGGQDAPAQANPDQPAPGQPGPDRTSPVQAGLGEPSPAQEHPAHEAPEHQRAQGPVGHPAPASVVAEAPVRMVLRPVALPEPTAEATALAGRRFALLGERGAVTESLSARLAAHGAEPVVLDPGHLLTDQDGPWDGVLHLAALGDGEGPLLPESFPVFQAALGRGPRWLIAAARSAAPDRASAAPDAAAGGTPGDAASLNGPADGLRGMFRTIVQEYPDTVARVVEVAPEDSATDVATALVGELLSTERAPVVLRSSGGRYGLELVEAGLGPLGDRGAGPAGDGAAEAAAIGLDRDSVILLVGGARGITARFAATLASAARCRIELAGRTAAPVGPEDPATRSAPDRAALRAALAAQESRSPAEIERAVAQILAQREIRATVEQLGRLGSAVRYHSVDVRDAEAVHRLVKEIHAEHGRLDGVVHAAGVIEDRLLAQKEFESFRRVFDTKVDGARTLLEAMADLPDRPRFAVLFGSVSAVVGNRGQVDYAAANDALQSLGSRWAARRGHRALTVHWGPWAPTGEHNGMVTPELAREYARRGLKLIDPEEGTLCLLRELAWGEESADAVVYTGSGW